ncbi:MAG: hypothetical protein F2787_06630 [Actinobacteria bacterium]|uniref:Unannotated protein n=1 Tax=freshwater metagenome TaxID=449393 RepID=A0A6J7E604_9ZZZZ|nr:hypothetical protein [Actinomycetota bacterium]MSW46732.1 hypothetical protein [Actinomycetota bacterium]MSX25419.1 hypothetical protein [Actinomycetota bacterium]MSY47042.1 hypothetical protein [Actinomycetota bacterium]MTB00270.1 hypothetical protein [Actinomycetota bacterium]
MNEEVTQEDLVAEIKEQLSQIDSLPIDEHASAFEGIHQKLGEALSTIDGL